MTTKAKEHFIAPKRKDFKAPTPLRQPPALAKDFPASKAGRSSIFTLTGVTSQSTEALRRVLTENDHSYDMWEKARRCEPCRYTVLLT